MTHEQLKRPKPATSDSPPPTLQRAAIAQAPAVAPAIVHDVLRAPGQPLDDATRDAMEPRFGQDFGDVRVHTDAQAAASADAVQAQAYTVGNHVAFGAGEYQPGSSAGQRLLAHELAHVVQQGSKDGNGQLPIGKSNTKHEQEAEYTARLITDHHSPDQLSKHSPKLSNASFGVMRAPKADTTQPRTFIIVYGSGQVNPSINQHNVGGMFRIVANQKLQELKARLKQQANQHTFIFEYTPTEVELKKVLNTKYPVPVAEIHIFSHGWGEGANLGGPIPPNLKNRPTETPEDAEQRRLTKNDLDAYDINFAEDATVVFYGCNIGNIGAADNNRPFAQDFSDKFGVAVTASTKSTHFEDKAGWHQVPDTGGKMIDFTPTSATASAKVEQYIKLLQRLKQAQDQQKKAKVGLLGYMFLDDKIRTFRAEVDSNRALAHRMSRFLPDTERTSTVEQINKLEAVIH